MVCTHLRRILLFFQLFQLIFLHQCSYLYFKGMFQVKFDIMTLFHLNMLKETSKSVSRVLFAIVHCVKNEPGLCTNFDGRYTAIAIAKKPQNMLMKLPELHSLFSYHCTGSVIIIYIVDLYL